MTSNLPRYRRTRTEGGLHPLAKAGIVVLLPILVVAGLIVVMTKGEPAPVARAESGRELPFQTPDTSPTTDIGTPAGTPSEPGETPSATGSATPSPEESNDSSSEGNADNGGSGGGSSEAVGDEGLTVTSPPREPTSRPTVPGPSDPSEPSEPEPTSEPTEEPSEEPTGEPSEPADPEPSEPSEPPSEEPELPDLPIIDLSGAESQMLKAVDKARANAGCPALRVDARLTIASRQHSEDMRDRDYVDSVSPDGETPADRAADEGYTARVGENLAYGLENPQQVVREWSDGGDERSRLLDCSFTSAGVGTKRGGFFNLSSWWTLMLGTA